MDTDHIKESPTTNSQFGLLKSKRSIFLAILGIAWFNFLSIAYLTQMPNFFLMITVVNLLVGLYIFSLMPEFLMYMFLWLITHTMYRVRHRGLEQIPDEGPAVIVCNHVSFIDWLILAASIRRPVRFVMYAPIFRMPIINLFCRAAKAIPISSRREEPATLRKAFVEISVTLFNRQLMCNIDTANHTLGRRAAGDVVVQCLAGLLMFFLWGFEVVMHMNPYDLKDAIHSFNIT
jgi:hypothetical protein